MKILSVLRLFGLILFFGAVQANAVSDGKKSAVLHVHADGKSQETLQSKGALNRAERLKQLLPNRLKEVVTNVEILAADKEMLHQLTLKQKGRLLYWVCFNRICEECNAGHDH
ncbi:MAG TPA: hypothetical protein VGT41_06525 [Candidatus Babeliales bacterium]|nr:hypothetical protein [Candidatus Babeliales bacterium]